MIKDVLPLTILPKQKKTKTKKQNKKTKKLLLGT
jgi:hypothetical protein